MPPRRKADRIAATIERWLAEERFKPGDRFPSEQALAGRFRVNHLTVRAALRRFVEAGRLERRVGAGTVVRAAARPGEAEPLAGPGRALAEAVGLAIPDAAHGFFTEVLRAVEGALLGTGRPLLLGHSREIAERERQIVEGWAAQGVRRMIVAATVPDPTFYRALLARGVRLVLLDRRVPSVDAPSVTTGDQEAVAALVRLLVAQGHRRIVHLAGPAGIWTAEVRRRMFLDAMVAAGLPAADGVVVPAGYFVEDGYRATRALLAAGPPPRAIFAANDPAAVGAIRALGERGLGVPADVSVVGYGDDLDLSRSFGLTTVRQFPERLGAEAVRLVLAHEAPRAADSVEIHPEVVVRASAAPAPRS